MTKTPSTTPASQRQLILISPYPRFGTSNYFGLYQDIQEATKVAEQARLDLFGEYAGRE